MRPTLPWLSLTVGGLLFGVGMTLDRRLPEPQPGAPGQRQPALAGGADLRRHRRLHDDQGPVRQLARGSARPGGAAAGRARLARPGPAHGVGASGAGRRQRCAGAAIAPWRVPLARPLRCRDARFRAQPLATGWRRGASARWWSGAGTSAATSASARTRETLEDSFFATNSRTLESLSFIAPLAYGLELLMLWTDPSLHLILGMLGHRRHGAGRGRRGAGGRPLPLGGFRVAGRPARPAASAPC